MALTQAGRALAAGVIAVLLLLSGCSRPPAEQAIREALAAMEQGLQDRKASAVMAHVAPDFQDREGRDPQMLRRYLAALFLRHQRIHVLLANLEIEIAGDAAAASVQATLLGGSGILPQHAQRYFVTMEWRQQAGDWLLYRLDWESLARDAEF